MNATTCVFNIKPDSRAPDNQQAPIAGKWYCGFDVHHDPRTGERYVLDGMLAQWDAEGYFIDESGDEVDMTGYDFLVEQV